MQVWRSGWFSGAGWLARVDAVPWSRPSQAGRPHRRRPRFASLVDIWRWLSAAGRKEGLENPPKKRGCPFALSIHSCHGGATQNISTHAPPLTLSDSPDPGDPSAPNPSNANGRQILRGAILVDMIDLPSATGRSNFIMPAKETISLGRIA
jgi:hypothetical protein